MFSLSHYFSPWFTCGPLVIYFLLQFPRHVNSPQSILFLWLFSWHATPSYVSLATLLPFAIPVWSIFSCNSLAILFSLVIPLPCNSSCNFPLTFFLLWLTCHVTPLVFQHYFSCHISHVIPFPLWFPCHISLAIPLPYFPCDALVIPLSYLPCDSLALVIPLPYFPCDSLVIFPLPSLWFIYHVTLSLFFFCRDIVSTVIFLWNYSPCQSSPMLLFFWCHFSWDSPVM